ncbi:hypothetical protein JL475_18620 [Streptomyces sp. M2CJ-2]|uniref:hypothetical protein n=1 Tax=Streptomyces sp. M2CJ-2 TaxID=2803948 RepID=UPI0019295C85|nr:hypothetical protein [Streptomyces sp. M2CJ-2]MBL3667968.1 hypothetical protein [Streptomyces sp. M2CJ-2]
MDRIGLRCVADGAAVLTVGADGLPDSLLVVVDPTDLVAPAPRLSRGLADARAEMHGRG